MTTSLATAIAKVRSIGDRICSNQVYCFEQYDAENFDATELCEYLGIPYTDDLFVEYPAHRTFHPVAAERIAALARELGVAALPDDYVGQSATSTFRAKLRFNCARQNLRAR